MATTRENPGYAYSLLAGCEVSTWSEEWRLDCACATYAAMPLAQMNAAIDGGSEIRGVRQMHGEAAAVRLRADVDRWMRLKSGR